MIFSSHYVEKGVGKLAGEMRKKRELELMTEEGFAWT